jgi:DNA polymerase-1
MSRVVIVDGMNFMHRARSGWQMGPAPVVFNFMRNFRALVDELKPDRMYFVLEGKARHRREVFAEYKANRKVEPGSKEAIEREKFFSQVTEVIELLKSNFPISVVRHPHFECDDTVYNLIKRSQPGINWTVVSNDTDFIQLLNEFENVKIWNPMKKAFVKGTEYDYVTWKSLRGDDADNIPGIVGIGDKKAEELARDGDALRQFLGGDSDANDKFLLNFHLIKFATWTDDEAAEMTTSSPQKNWSPLRSTFEKYGFNSLLKEGAWNKFVGTFDTLWEV